MPMSVRRCESAWVRVAAGPAAEWLQPVTGVCGWIGLRSALSSRGDPVSEETEMVTRRTAEETARLGDEIYDRDIRRQVEADHHGAVVAIDVDSGSWAIGDTVIAATDGLRTQRPGAVDVWLLRVGHRALHHFGGRPLRSAE